MAAPNADSVRGIPGRLVWDPSDLSDPEGDFTYGTGTLLGLVSGVEVIARPRSYVLRAPEYGGKAVEEYELCRDYLVSASMRGFDTDALGVLGFTVASSVASESLSNYVGKATSARSGVLLFAPRDPDNVGFIARRALPRLKDSGRVPFALHNRLQFLAMFRCIPDTNGDDIAFGTLANLSL